MSIRALIVAIDEYPQAQGLAKQLPGSVQAAKNFRAWLVQRAKDKGETIDQLLFCSNPLEPDGRGATSVDLHQAFEELRNDGVGSTDELFVFFSGHGFSYVQRPTERADLILASDFQKSTVSAHCCFNVGKIIAWLRLFGRGRHFFFIDACRTKIDSGDLSGDASPVGTWPYGGEATTYLIQSTSPYSVAAAGGPFPTELLAGLGGKGRAKAWSDDFVDAMVVHHESLHKYLEGVMPSQQKPHHDVNGEEGATDGLLAVLRPIPSVTASLNVTDYQPSDDIAVTIRRRRGPAEAPIPMTVNPLKRLLEPDTYTFEIAIAGQPVVEPIRTVRLYDDETIPFVKGSPKFGGFESLGSDSPRPWVCLPQETIKAVLPSSVAGGIDFAESLGGAIVDPDLNLSLALLGGGRICKTPGRYNKIARFPLHDFSNEPPGAAPIYVLAGFDDQKVNLSVQITASPPGPWLDVPALADMPGIYQAYIPTQPGPKLISFRLRNGAVYTVAALTSPNRALLVTLTLNQEGEFCVSQYLLPLGMLINELPAEVREQLANRQLLQDVRFLAEANQAFRKRRRVAKEPFAKKMLDDLLSARWLNPLGAAMACYELLRRKEPYYLLHPAIENMQRFFPDLPDTATIAKLAGRAVSRPAGVPLFLDGLRAFDAAYEHLPLPSTHLDFSSPWTAWHAVPG